MLPLVPVSSSSMWMLCCPGKSSWKSIQETVRAAVQNWLDKLSKKTVLNTTRNCNKKRPENYAAKLPEYLGEKLYENLVEKLA